MKNLNNRQLEILYLVLRDKQLQTGAVLDHLRKTVDPAVSRSTIARDLEALVQRGDLTRHGQGRGAYYTPVQSRRLLLPVDVNRYFAVGPDERDPIFEQFQFGIFEALPPLFNDQELKDLHALNDTYRAHVRSLPQAILKKEFERLTIELSWKSSQIEGNTYSLIDTELLLTQQRAAEGKTAEETQMVLNHKAALDFIFGTQQQFTTLRAGDIEAIHAVLVKNMSVTSGIRQHGVGVTGTRYRPLDNQHQIREALEKMVTLVNQRTEPMEKALLANLIIAYIQPFVDGNKRTARLVGNALLLASDYCPLSFRSIDDVAYKQAVVLFYEQNNIHLFKELFIAQFRFAVKTYFPA